MGGNISMMKHIVFLRAHTSGGSLLLGCERYFLVLGHFENLMIFVPFYYTLLLLTTGTQIGPLECRKTCEKMAKTAHYQVTLSRGRKTLKIVVFTRTYRWGFADVFFILDLF